LRGEHAFELVATVLDGDAESLGSFRWPKRAAILFGGEGHGLERDLLAICDHRVTIAMSRGTDSLTMAVAAGIVLFHATGHD
jgi:TrmH family RNA methyltransferase